MSKKRVSFVRLAVRPPPTDGRPKNHLLAALPAKDFRRLASHLKTVPGEAIAHALASVGRQHTQAWLTDEGYDFTLLDDFRVVTTHDDVINRLRAEFIEMPGLRLTPEQVHRLCGVERALCQLVLDSLVDERFLCAKPDGHDARLVDGAMSRPLVATADRRADTRIATAS